MKVLVVTQYFWPELFRINDLVSGLKERGHEITVLTGMPNYPGGRFYKGYSFFSPAKDMFNKVPVYRVPVVPRGNGKALRMMLNYFSFALSASILGPFFCRKKFDLIFVFEPSPVMVGLPALVFKKINRAPILFWVQDIWPETLFATGVVRSKPVLNYIGKLVGILYSGCSRILVQSRAFFPRIQKLGVPGEKILYFPNSAEELYKPVTLNTDAPERALMSKGFCVMFAGNIGAAQDFPTILSAAESLKKYSRIHWVILGNGRMRTWVEHKIKEMGLDKTVHLLGRYPTETMPNFFSMADVLLVTLKNEYIFELTIPAKIQSYLACGKPVAAALSGEGARIIEESGGGITAPPGNFQALADSILRLYKMSESDRKKMGRLGREYFEMHFKRDKLLDRLDGWMKEEINQ